jgi:hypothetical protein
MGIIRIIPVSQIWPTGVTEPTELTVNSRRLWSSRRELNYTAANQDQMRSLFLHNYTQQHT